MKTGGTRAGAAPENRDGGRRAVVERLKEYGQTRADSDWNDLDVETRRLIRKSPVAAAQRQARRPVTPAHREAHGALE